MIRRTIYVTFVFLTIFIIFVYFFKWPSLPLNQRDGNIRKIEDYIYSDCKYKYVLVGSSISDKLIANNFNLNLYNLALNGKSSLDGLEIIKKSGNYPQYIIIETNKLNRKIDDDLIANSFNPLFYNLKRRLPVFRQKYRPESFLNYCYYGFSNKFKHNSVENPIRNKSIDQKLIVNNKPNVETKADLAKVYEYIRFFSNKKVKLFFVNIPSVLNMDTLSFKFILDNVTKDFQDITTIHFIDYNKSESYITGDGVHLLPESAKHFSSWLEREIKLDNDNE